MTRLNSQSAGLKRRDLVIFHYDVTWPLLTSNCCILCIFLLLTSERTANIHLFYLQVSNERETFHGFQRYLLPENNNFTNIITFFIETFITLNRINGMLCTNLQLHGLTVVLNLLKAFWTKIIVLSKEQQFFF